MSTLEQLAKNWQDQSKKIREERTQVNTEIDALDTRIAELTPSTKNPFKYLGKAFNKVARVPKLKKQRAALLEQRDALDANLHRLSDDTYAELGRLLVSRSDELSTAYAAKTSDLKTAEERLAELTGISEKVSEALDSVETAIAKCGNAKWLEYGDAFSDNIGVSLISYFFTSGAGESLEEAGQKLKALEAHMERENIATIGLSQEIRELFDANDFDLLFGAISDFVGIFTSLDNAEKLNRAKDKMVTIREGLDGFGQSVGEKLVTAQRNVVVNSEDIATLHDTAIDATVKEMPKLAPLVDTLKAGMTPSNDNLDHGGDAAPAQRRNSPGM